MRLILTVLGPVTWLGFLIAIFWQLQRLRHERKVFNTAIDRHATGLWAGLIGGVGVAIVSSVLAIALGLVLPQSVWLSFSGLALVALVLSGFGFSPWWFGLAAVLVPLIGSEFASWRVAALVALLWLGEALLLRVFDPPIDVPTIKMGKRGADIAVYDHRQFYWLPLILPVSGDWFSGLPWWPTLTVGTTHFALIGLPLILGVVLRTKKQLPQHATRKWAWQYLLAGGLAVLVAVWGWFDGSQLPAIGLAVLAVGVGIANRVALHGGVNYISQTATGVRIVAVLPETPAAKMGLEAGDIVLLCNSLAVHTPAELYAAIQQHPTYCRLRVQRLDGEIKLSESAIFEGAPHTLGMITFAEEQAL